MGARMLSKIFRLLLIAGLAGTPVFADQRVRVNGESEGGSGGGEVIRFDYSSTNLESLFTAPVEVAPAPGAGRTLHPILMVSRVVTTNNGTGGNAGFQVRHLGETNVLTGAGSTLASNSNSTGTRIGIGYGSNFTSGIAGADIDNLPLMLSLNQTTGTGWVGSVTVSIWYVVK